MNKILKGSIAVAIIAVIMLSSFLVVKADGQWYNSTISISTNSTLTGKERSYSYDYYRLDITPTKLIEGDINPGYVRLVSKVIRPLYRLGIKYGTEEKASKTTNFNVSTALNKKTSISYGNCGDGKRYLTFSTVGSWGAGYGGLTGTADIYNYS